MNEYKQAIGISCLRGYRPNKEKNTGYTTLHAAATVDGGDDDDDNDLLQMTTSGS